MKETTTPDGETVYISTSEGERGSKGAFFLVYRSPDGEGRYGYFCANCETLDNAMDSMGRIECNRCGNLRKATEWDAAHE
ncbi:DUF5816 domain-containing protein [Haladaptatus salinisoli]|uniref:DUF5816 domain-containing protein n=1 Tax=Haladaptatus salinisoli TaxID=2884876 RepID=UPI001D0B7DCB|nr:DUF5816 domain-containing protein [Haladaptatus salinisoli]